MNPHIFRENDIRGRADRDLDDRTVEALGAVLGRRASAGTSPRLVVGRDGRLHSARIRAALVRGARAYVEVIDLGLVPTPVVSFVSVTEKPPIAVMITGSHNPAEENGFKISADGTSLHGAEIEQLRDEIASELARSPSEASAPRPLRHRTADESYLSAAASSLRLGHRRTKVVIDAGNGAAGPLVLALYQRLGFEVVPLYCDIDGRFPHHHPDPTVEKNLSDLIRAVSQHGAEVGIGLDGDGDRLGLVDGRGRVVWGDQLLILLGRALLEEAPGAHIIAEVKCSQATFDVLSAAGGDVEMWKVGHSLIKARMRETGAQLAGEMSGHFFFAHRWLGFDDGLYAGARLLEVLSRTSRSLEHLVDELPVTHNTPELRVACPDEKKTELVEVLARRLRENPATRSANELDGVRATFEHGWILVRASTTQAALVMRLEASSPHHLEDLQRLLEDELARAQVQLGLV